ncbi:hypothetical protein NDU88_007006 [Pleurodeles waltl]|uniref:Uncharacterized protein n=1 Tax=Pleurodeles waltl TaxID=8319 RepID=A0AAV7LWH6_PLEWA|nr:hypothetical protein NDU88_007006 [Pleurodeles waltl]
MVFGVPVVCKRKAQSWTHGVWRTCGLYEESPGLDAWCLAHLWFVKRKPRAGRLVFGAPVVCEKKAQGWTHGVWRTCGLYKESPGLDAWFLAHLWFVKGKPRAGRMVFGAPVVCKRKAQSWTHGVWRTCGL